MLFCVSIRLICFSNAIMIIERIVHIDKMYASLVYIQGRRVSLARR